MIIIIIYLSEKIEEWMSSSFKDANGQVFKQNLFNLRFDRHTAYLFQQYVTDSHITEFFKEMNKADMSNLKCVIVERSIYTNVRIFGEGLKDEGKITHLEYLTLMKKGTEFFEIMCQTYNLAPIFVHLFDNVPATLERLRKRNREGEEVCGEELLADLKRRYFKLFDPPLPRSFPYHVINIDLEQYRLKQISESYQPLQSEQEFYEQNSIDIDAVVDKIMKDVELGRIHRDPHHLPRFFP